jgi:hypothetical protein
MRAVAPFRSRFTDEQREAVVAARAKHPAPRVAELAAAGRLRNAAGEQLAAFEIAPTTIRDLCSRARRRSIGEAPSPMANLEPVQAIEGLRKRLVAAADHLLADYEHQVARNPSKADPERLRQLLRCAREAAALSPNAPTGLAQREASGLRAPTASPGQQPGESTLAGRILAEHRRGGSPGRIDPSPPPPMPAAPPEPEPELTEKERRRAEVVRSVLGDLAGTRTDAELAALTNAEVMAQRTTFDPTPIPADEIAG